MNNKRLRTPLATAVGTTLTGMMLIAGTATAASNPFALTELGPSHTQIANHGKCGAGKCGGSSGVDGKCGAGKCGSNMGGKCGVGKCGGTVPAPETEMETDQGDGSGQTDNN